jgi:hypothetical protein
MLPMFVPWEHFGQDIRSLLRVATTINTYGSILYQFSNPVPMDSDVFGPLMELRVVRHHDGTIIIAPDFCRNIVP